MKCLKLSMKSLSISVLFQKQHVVGQEKLISWNGREPKIDVRDWSPDHSKMSKGLTFTVDEIKELTKLVENL